MSETERNMKPEAPAGRLRDGLPATTDTTVARPATTSTGAVPKCPDCGANLGWDFGRGNLLCQKCGWVPR